MSISDDVVGRAEATARIDSALQNVPSDYMYRGGYQTIEIPGPDAQLAIMNFGPPDPRRSVDPLEFAEISVKCFCDWRRQKPAKWFPLSNASGVFLLRDRAHQFAHQCGPEPTMEHYSDMMGLAESTKAPRLTVVNLTGSGASVPQHFHTQIYPLQQVSHGAAPSENTLAKLWRNVTLKEQTEAVSKGITITDVVFPIWGIQVTFSEDYGLPQIGELLYRSVHREVRYRSQLALSYNLYINSASPRRITILFREAHKERVFESSKIRPIIESFTSESEAVGIAMSPNRFWRWAWLECIGGLPARDDSFADTTRFGWKFWSHVWSAISLEETYQNRVRERIIGSLQKQLGG